MRKMPLVRFQEGKMERKPFILYRRASEGLGGRIYCVAFWDPVDGSADLLLMSVWFIQGPLAIIADGPRRGLESPVKAFWFTYPAAWSFLRNSVALATIGLSKKFPATIPDSAIGPNWKYRDLWHRKTA